jgi:hypothetical protein
MRVRCVVAVLAATIGVARADDEAERERPTAVEVTLAGTHVQLRARFVLDIEGPAVGLGAGSFALPRGAVVTAGAVTVEGTRHALALDKASTVDKAFDALTLKPAGNAQRAWAFVLQGGSGEVRLDTLAPRAAHGELELVLDAATCFYNDARFVALPASWWQRVRATQREAVRVPRDEIAAACGDDDDSVQWLGFPARELANQPAGERRIGVLAGRLPLETTHFARVELELARELTSVPRDLHTVILIDHSRSMTADELDIQRAIVAAYLRGAPASRVQVIAYARTAEPLLPSWMIASHAGPQLDRVLRAQAPRNGSNVDAALAAAASWLGRVEGTKRIVLFSDERLAERLHDVERLRALLADGTLVHLVHPQLGFTTIERNDDAESPLVALAAGSQGLATFGAVDDAGNVDATVLLRPVGIDHLQIDAASWKTAENFQDERACGDSLREGHSCAWWGEGSGAAGPITITGLLWNKRITRVVRADPSQARALARVLSVMAVLDEQLQAQVEQLAVAVNATWSLFAQWGGGGGYEDVGGFGSMHVNGIGGSSHDVGIVDRIGQAFGPLDLRAQLAPAVARCTPGDARFTVAIETTLEEIVDVEVQGAPPALAGCVAEAVWDLTLRIPGAPQHATTRVAFGNKR